MGLGLATKVLSQHVRWRGVMRYAGGTAAVHPSARAALSRRIISPRRRAVRNARLRVRSLRYAAGLRRAVTRHVWRDHRRYACVWCSVYTEFCANFCDDNVRVLSCPVSVFNKDFDNATSSGSA